MNLIKGVYETNSKYLFDQEKLKKIELLVNEKNSEDEQNLELFKTVMEDYEKVIDKLDYAQKNIQKVKNENCLMKDNLKAIGLEESTILKLQL